MATEIPFNSQDNYISATIADSIFYLAKIQNTKRRTTSHGKEKAFSAHNYSTFYYYFYFRLHHRRIVRTGR